MVAKVKRSLWVCVFVLALLAAMATIMAISTRKTRDHTDQALVPWDSPEDWVRRASEGGGDAVFVRETVSRPSESKGSSNPDVELVGKIPTLGRLTGDDYAQLLQSAAQQSWHEERTVLRYQNEMDRATPSDVAREAKLLQYREIALAAEQAIAKGDYLVVQQGHSQSIPIPPACSRMTFGATKEGVPVDVVVLLSHKNYPSLANATEYLGAAERWWLEQVAIEFNRRPYEQRSRDITKYREILQASPRTAADRQFLRERFPSKLVVDEGSMTLRIATR